VEVRSSGVGEPRLIDAFNNYIEQEDLRLERAEERGSKIYLDWCRTRSNKRQH
jgi:hypothetical protein